MLCFSLFLYYVCIMRKSLEFKNKLSALGKSSALQVVVLTAAVEAAVLKSSTLLWWRHLVSACEVRPN